MGLQVRIASTGVTIDCAADPTILHAAVGGGVDHPYVCATGNRGARIPERGDGGVSMLPYGDNALSVEQVGV